MNALVVAILLGVVASAEAQVRVREPRVFVTLGGGVQSGGGGLTDRIEWDDHLETAVANVDYGSGASGWFAGGVAVRLWRQLGAGAAFSSASRDSTAEIAAQVPHPFFFDQPRAIEGQSPSLSRSEKGVHIQAIYVLPARGRMRVMLSAGPSRLSISQDAVTDVRYTESFPFDTATFQRADTRRLSDAAIGFNVGAEAAYMLARTAGIAGTLRFTRATVDLARPDGGTLSMTAGGLQAGAGVRFAF